MIKWVALALGSAVLAGGLAAQDDVTTVLPPDQEEVIHYLRSDDLRDPVSLLKRDLEAGKRTLNRKGKSGYLESVLNNLGISPATQTLVFSKTSDQRDLVSPQTPRAIYFNDSVYVAFVQGSDHLEIASVDPNKGAVFFRLSQGSKPLIERSNDCVRCHFGPKTSFVPGFFVRSALTTADGVARSQVTEFVSGHNSPLAQRWGGWYVTGTAQNDVHVGNSFLEDPLHPEAFDPRPGSAVTDISDRFDTSPYPAKTSDIVALMLLDDSVRVHDLLIAARYETLFAERDFAAQQLDKAGLDHRIARAGDALVSALLFLDEQPLKGPLTGTAGLEGTFASAGPRDHAGRSLRDLDLGKRMFKYPCHYLIYSPEFSNLPPRMKSYVWRKVSRVLNGAEKGPGFVTLTADDRRAVREILLDTHPEARNYL